MVSFRSKKPAKEMAGNGDKSNNKSVQKQQRGGGGSMVHTAMFFDNDMRAEWLLSNPGAKEEKIEPWLFDGVGRREKLNSYNMQRLPGEPLPSKEGEGGGTCCMLCSLCFSNFTYITSLL
jgi:hypothetical protein